MADLFDKIFQNFKTYYNNGYNLLKKLRDIYYGGPQDVTLQWQDPDSGAIQNLTVPSFAKMRDRFISDVNSVMYKTIYVDAENGSDNTGDGSSSAPFKSLQKAIDSIPPGGQGYITIVGNYTVTESIIKVVNKSITISLSGELHFKPIVRVSGSYKYKGVTKFIVASNSLLRIASGYSNFQIIIDEDYPDDWDSAMSHANGQTIFSACSSRIEIGAYNVKHNSKILVKIPAGFSLFSTSTSDWYFSPRAIHSIFSFSVASSESNHKIILDGNFLINGTQAPTYVLNFYINYPSLKLVDSQGNNIDLKNKIVGIIKDSNGIPRNIVSNVVF